MNTPKVTGLVVIPSKTHGVEPAGEDNAAETGWDPYEVWRTRVLQPRIEPRAAETRADASSKPFLVRSS